MGALPLWLDAVEDDIDPPGILGVFAPIADEQLAMQHEDLFEDGIFEAVGSSMNQPHSSVTKYSMHPTLAALEDGQWL